MLRSICLINAEIKKCGRTILAALFMCLYCASAEPQEEYLHSLQEKALSLKLHEARYWKILLHYEKSLTGLKSVVDDPEFFASPQGKQDTKKELLATLEAFFEPPVENETQHPVCKWIARFHWLSAQLEINPSRLPHSDCAIYHKVIKELNPESVALSYPASFINSPASMFGHTLLVIDSKGKNRLLSKTLNYAAQVNTSFGPLFAIKGIFGMYKGYHVILPYYDKVEQYNDISQRDIWEYELNLNPDERNRLIRHVWELQNIYSDYYFFKENCSYNLLFALEAARPGVELNETFTFQTIPIDTVKLIKEKGFISKRYFRPSQAVKIETLAEGLSPKDIKLVKKIARGQVETKQAEDYFSDIDLQRRFISLTAEYTQLLYAEEEISAEAYRTRFVDILKIRSKLGVAEKGAYEPEEPEAPELGHHPIRKSVAIGKNSNQAYASVALRPAYHALEDPLYGYIPGAQIEFFETELRYNFDDENVLLKNFNMINVLSLAPSSTFTDPASWSFYTGYQKRELEQHISRDEIIIRGSSGKTRRITESVMAYLMFGAWGVQSNKLDADYDLGPVAQSGLAWRNGNAGQGTLKASYLGLLLNNRENIVEINFDQSVNITRNQVISLNVDWSDVDGVNFWETSVSWRFFNY